MSDGTKLKGMEAIPHMGGERTMMTKKERAELVLLRTQVAVLMESYCRLLAFLDVQSGTLANAPGWALRLSALNPRSLSDVPIVQRLDVLHTVAVERAENEASDGAN